MENVYRDIGGWLVERIKLKCQQADLDLILVVSHQSPAKTFKGG